jgi:hypothetical protein
LTQTKDEIDRALQYLNPPKGEAPFLSPTFGIELVPYEKSFFGVLYEFVRLVGVSRPVVLIHDSARVSGANIIL